MLCPREPSDALQLFIPLLREWGTCDCETGVCAWPWERGTGKELSENLSSELCTTFNSKQNTAQLNFPACPLISLTLLSNFNENILNNVEDFM